MKQIKKIGILAPYAFPEGMAPTTRIIAYGYGLVQNGIDVEVIINSVYFSEDIQHCEGVIKGLNYRYPYLYNKKRYHSKLYRICYANWALLWNCIKSIIKSNNAEAFDYVLLSFDSPRELIFYSFVLKLFGIKTVFIGDEFPEEIRQLNSDVSLHTIRLFKIAYHFISARILMTKNLCEFYNKKVCDKPSYILSSIIDTSRFDNLQIMNNNRDYLCYMGNMMLAKDNVDNIVRAYGLIKDKYPNIDLWLFGTPSASDYELISNLIDELGLKERVILKGRASYNDVPNILAHAKILVTSQPKTKRAEGGFPTKMCEYMMTGVPALLTDVGEITQYVTNDENVYIVEPCNHKAYADKIDFILSNYDTAIIVAKRARQFVEYNYGSKYATKGLVEFLNKL